MFYCVKKSRHILILYVTSQQVAGSIPDEVTGFFN
jgi:hypothetical protein